MFLAKNDGEATIDLELEVVGTQNGESEVNKSLYSFIGGAATSIIIFCAITSLLFLHKHKQRKKISMTTL